MGTIWEQMLYLRHNKIIQPMKATAFMEQGCHNKKRRKVEN